MSEQRSEVEIAREHEQREQQKADEERKRTEQADQEAKEEVKALEEDPPKDLKDWPSGKAKYETFGGPEHETSYDEAATSKLGPSEVRHREDGAVEVGGEEVDNPDEFKGDPIPGGPTDESSSEASSGGEGDDDSDEESGDEGDSGEAQATEESEATS